jgi:hypothetical protein
MAGLDHAPGRYPGCLLEWLETETIVHAMPVSGQLKWKYVVCTQDTIQVYGRHSKLADVPLFFTLLIYRGWLVIS